MTKNKTILIAYFSLLLISGTQSGCKKGWLDVNYNPTELTDSSATPDVVLPPLLKDWPGALDINFTINSIGVLHSWMGYWCEPRYSYSGDESTTYNITRSMWSAHPKNGPSHLESKALRTNQTFYAAIAKIIQVIMYSRTVDVLNNLPYTEAFKINIRQPKYDSGQFIYEALMKELDLAITMIQQAQLDKNPKISSADIMFHGDKTKWVKFANTLKLRLLVHQANRTDRAAYINTEINKIKVAGANFLNSGEDAAVNAGFILESANPYYGYYAKFYRYASTWPPVWPSASANVVALNFLKENNDPRIGLFYALAEQPVPSGGPEPFTQPLPAGYRGSKFGLPVTEAMYPYQGPQYVSQLGGLTTDGPVTPASSGILKGYDMPAWVMTSIESLFLQAEAIQRGWLPGNAEQAYKDAVKESFRWLNAGGNSTRPELSDAIFESWYTSEVAGNNPNVSWQAAPDKYKLLMFQKYLAFNSIEPFETWVDYRRNGAYPNIPLSADPNRVGNILPVRFLYPEQEYLNNGPNVRAQGEINVFTSKIWWMP